MHLMIIKQSNFKLLGYMLRLESRLIIIAMDLGCYCLYCFNFTDSQLMYFALLILERYFVSPPLDTSFISLCSDWH